MRTRKTITLPKEVAEWIYRQVKLRKFFNFSHACEVALLELMEREEKKEEEGS